MEPKNNNLFMLNSKINIVHFLRSSLLFILPAVTILTYIEFINRINSPFHAKSQYITKNKNAIEVMILGSSQTWRAINPEHLTIKTAPLAHGGSSFNINYLLFKKYVTQFPKLKAILLETSYHTFEDYLDKSWDENYFYNIYYGINNYGGKVPFTNNWMITANFRESVKKAFVAPWYRNKFRYNQFGYNTSFNLTLHKHHYSREVLKKRHSEENPENYRKNAFLLDKFVAICKEKHIEIIFFSAPKYYTYNKNYKKEKLERRNFLLNKYENTKGVHFWNYEEKYEKNKFLFYDEDHLNTFGSKKLTQELNTRFLELLKAKSSTN